MSIKVTCACGKTADVLAALAGKSYKCPACGASTTVPQPEAVAAVAPVAQGEKRCYQCKATVTADSPICRRCGWDGEKGRRCCLACSGWMTPSPNMQLAPVIGGAFLVLAFVGGWLGGFFGGLAVGCALAAVGGLVGGLTLEYRCRECKQVAPASMLSAAELEEVRGKKFTLFLGAGGFAVGAVAAVAIWLGVVFSLVRRGEEVEGPPPDMQALEAKGEAAIPELIRALKDARVSLKAQELLHGLGPAAVRPLADALRDEHELVRKGAAETLKRFGPDAREAIPALAEAMKEDDSIRWPAALALEKIGEEAVPALAEALQSGKDEVRQEAARSLAAIGANASAALPALTEAVRDKAMGVRYEAVYALSKLGDEGIPPMIEALKDREASVRGRAAEYLGYKGPAAAAAAPAIEGLLNDPDEDVRWKADRALKSINR